METMQHGYRSFSLLMDLNWDRLLYVTAIAFGLFAGAWITSYLAQL